MKVHRDGSTTPLIDASVHVFFRDNRDLRDQLREPFKSRGFPDVDMDWYGAPGGEYSLGTTRASAPGPVNSRAAGSAPVTARASPGPVTSRTAGSGVPAAATEAAGQPGRGGAAGGQPATGAGQPGSDPEVVGVRLFEEEGVDVAVLHAMTRGVLPDRHLASALLAAHNEMLAERWLAGNRFAERYRGTIRVNPDDVTGALREIKRWKDHPRFVQVGVPLQSRELYGKPQFWPIWEAAADAGLPVAVHIETGHGVMLPPTPSGHTRTYEQYVSFMALNYLYHLYNMIAEGVFERYDGLKMVWADGAADFLTPFTWRMDTFGRPHLEQTPWAPRMPSDYLTDHCFFVAGSLDGPGDVPWAGDWLDFTGKEKMIMFGSSYPHWQLNTVDDLPAALTDEQRDRICWGNAAALYGIDVLEGAAQ